MKINKCTIVTVWLIEDTNSTTIPFRSTLEKPSVEQIKEWRRTDIRVHEREFVVPDPSEYRGE